MRRFLILWAAGAAGLGLAELLHLDRAMTFALGETLGACLVVGMDVFDGRRRPAARSDHAYQLRGRQLGQLHLMGEPCTARTGWTGPRATGRR